MWQRFTERARRVILFAQEEAGKMNSAHVGTEHLLLGLMREGEGVAAQILRNSGLSIERISAAVLQEIEAGTQAPAREPKLTSKAKRVLELAADEARRMRHNYIGTEHVLLALLREKDGLAAKTLVRCGLDLDTARTRVLEYLGPDDELRTKAPPHPGVGWQSGESPSASSRRIRAQNEHTFRVSPELEALLIAATTEASATGHEEMSIEHLMLVLLNDTHPFSAWLHESGVDRQHAIDSLRERLQSTLPSAEQLARQEALMELHAQKNAAIERDDYEEAARCRDEIERLEKLPLQPETDEPKEE